MNREEREIDKYHTYNNSEDQVKNGTDTPLVLAQEGGYYRAIRNEPSLDSLLGMEGLKKVKFYSSDGNGEYTLEQLLNVGYDFLKNSRVAEVVVYNEKGEAIPFLLDESLQEEFFPLSP